MLQRPTKPGVESSNLSSRATKPALTLVRGEGRGRPPADDDTFVARVRAELARERARLRAAGALKSVLRLFADPIHRALKVRTDLKAGAIDINPARRLMGSRQ